MALVEQRPRSATATALTPIRLLVVRPEQIAAQVGASPTFAMQVMASMSRRLRRLLEEEVRLQRMEEEMRIAHQIQLSLLPEEAPRIPGWEFAAVYRSARQVGGDLYDFILSPDDPEHLHLVVADVTGKGVPAALVMALARTAIRAAITGGCRPAETLQQTNRLIHQDTRSALFLSAFLARLNVKSGRLRYASGGHEWPLWRHGSGRVEALAARGFVLGAFDQARFEEREVVLAPGDAVVLYTDGVVEARNEEGELFGAGRLEELVGSEEWAAAEELLQAIVQAVDAYRGANPAADDLTAVVVRRQ
jgi:sigma-B regulation protein RsbU (phosphoserine phosphatase)